MKSTMIGMTTKVPKEPDAESRTRPCGSPSRPINSVESVSRCRISGRASSSSFFPASVRLDAAELRWTSVRPVVSSSRASRRDSVDLATSYWREARDRLPASAINANQ